jgi:hypothetical protein
MTSIAMAYHDIIYAQTLTITTDTSSSVAKHAIQHGQNPAACMSYKVLEENVPPCQVAEYERKWIKKFQDDGKVLINKKK